MDVDAAPGRTGPQRPGGPLPDPGRLPLALRVDAVASRTPTGEFQFSTVHLIDVDEVHGPRRSSDAVSVGSAHWSRASPTP